MKRGGGAKGALCRFVQSQIWGLRVGYTIKCRVGLLVSASSFMVVFCGSTTLSTGGGGGGAGGGGAEGSGGKCTDSGSTSWAGSNQHQPGQGGGVCCRPLCKGPETRS